MEGYLNKKGKGESSFGRRTWKKRWCILEDQTLSYFEDLDKQGLPVGPKGQLDITQAMVEGVDHKEKDFVFLIKSSHDNQGTFFQAPDLKSYNAWMKALIAAALDEGDDNIEDDYCHLGLSITAKPTTAEVNRAYRKAALRAHPDKGGDLTEFKHLQESFNRVIAYIEEEEKEKLYKYITYQVTLYKNPGEAGLGLVVLEDPGKKTIRIKSILPAVRIDSLSDEAQGHLSPGDVLIAVGAETVEKMPLTRVAQKLGDGRVPPGQSVKLTFRRRLFLDGKEVPPEADLFQNNSNDGHEADATTTSSNNNVGSEGSKSDKNSFTNPLRNTSPSRAGSAKEEKSERASTNSAPPTAPTTNTNTNTTGGGGEEYDIDETIRTSFSTEEVKPPAKPSVEPPSATPANSSSTASSKTPFSSAQTAAQIGSSIKNLLNKSGAKQPAPTAPTNRTSRPVSTTGGNNDGAEKGSAGGGGIKDLFGSVSAPTATNSATQSADPAPAAVTKATAAAAMSASEREALLADLALARDDLSTLRLSLAQAQQDLLQRTNGEKRYQEKVQNYVKQLMTTGIGSSPEETLQRRRQALWPSSYALLSEASSSTPPMISIDEVESLLTNKGYDRESCITDTNRLAMRRAVSTLVATPSGQAAFQQWQQQQEREDSVIRGQLGSTSTSRKGVVERLERFAEQLQSFSLSNLSSPPSPVH
eukprot:gene4458-4883_t